MMAFGPMVTTLRLVCEAALRLLSISCYERTTYNLLYLKTLQGRAHMLCSSRACGTNSLSCGQNPPNQGPLNNT